MRALRLDAPWVLWGPKSSWDLPASSCPAPQVSIPQIHMGGGGRRRCRIQTQAAADSECPPGPPPPPGRSEQDPSPPLPSHPPGASSSRLHAPSKDLSPAPVFAPDHWASPKTFCPQPLRPNARLPSPSVNDDKHTIPHHHSLCTCFPGDHHRGRGKWPKSCPCCVPPTLPRRAS